MERLSAELWWEETDFTYGDKNDEGASVTRRMQQFVRCIFITQGMKTLEVRMERHCGNAMQVAKFLQQNKSVAKVNYLGLPSHPIIQLQISK